MGNYVVKEDSDGLDDQAGTLLGVATKRGTKAAPKIEQSPITLRLIAHMERAIDTGSFKSAREISEKAGLSDSAAGKIMRGATEPRADTIAAIATALGLDPANIPPIEAAVPPAVVLTIQDPYAREAVEHLRSLGQLDDATQRAVAIFEQRYKDQAQPARFESFEAALAEIRAIRARGRLTGAWLEQVNREDQDFGADLLEAQRKARKR